HPDELRLGVDGAPDQPRTCGPIDVEVATGGPSHPSCPDRPIARSGGITTGLLRVKGREPRLPAVHPRARPAESNRARAPGAARVEAGGGNAAAGRVAASTRPPPRRRPGGTPRR